jgi:lipoate-protein ligase A
LELDEASRATVEENLALDESLLRRFDRATDAGGERLRLWQCPSPVVVVGRSGSLEREVDLDACAKAGVPIVRRRSGGGAVVLGPGCLNYSLVLRFADRPLLRDVAASYGTILGWIADALGLAGLARRGSCDLAWHGRKVSGNAQFRGRGGLLHHGTLLHAFDPGLSSRFLREPSRQPRYRAGRAHADFLGNLPFAPETLQARLTLAWETFGHSRTVPPRSRV